MVKRRPKLGLATCYHEALELRNGTDNLPDRECTGARTLPATAPGHSRSPVVADMTPLNFDPNQFIPTTLPLLSLTLIQARN